MHAAENKVFPEGATLILAALAPRDTGTLILGGLAYLPQTVLWWLRPKKGSVLNAVHIISVFKVGLQAGIFGTLL